MIKLLFLYGALLFTTVLLGQNITIKNLSDVVLGVVYQGNEQFLVTKSGYIKIKPTAKSINDKWTEYYRKAYGDSTIQNPNRIIEEQNLNLPVHFFIPLDDENWFDRKIEFEDGAFLYDFLKVDPTGKLTYKPGTIGLIGEMLKQGK